jgi:hypothetical protein
VLVGEAGMRKRGFRHRLSRSRTSERPRAKRSAPD